VKVQSLEKKFKELKAKRNRNSGNFIKPPSSNSPFTKPEDAPSVKKRGAKPGHKGHSEMFLEPTEQVDMLPGVCKCGCCDLVLRETEPFYIQPGNRASRNPPHREAFPAVPCQVPQLRQSRKGPNPTRAQHRLRPGAQVALQRYLILRAGSSYNSLNLHD